MKIILSRKGFDSSYGGMASPILPDGTLLSMPIPSSNPNANKYTDMTYDNKSYLQILTELKPTFKYEYCHLDPDIRIGCKNREGNWISLFGQCGAAQGHLINQSVNSGDIFLFFGWFRQVELINGKLRFVRNAPNLNVIFGYMQIQEIIYDIEKIKSYSWHPHSNEDHLYRSNNCLYSAKKSFSLDENLNGYGVLNYHNKRVLTKPGYTRTRWNLPDIFRNATISRHDNDDFNDNYFQSVSIGQEFVISENNEIIDWALHIIREI
jgi:hypothetical protein